MTSKGNQHCANCIGTLTFPIAEGPRDVVVYLTERERQGGELAMQRVT